MVPKAGVEPAHPYGARRILSPPASNQFHHFGASAEHTMTRSCEENDFHVLSVALPMTSIR